jgi:hypothetical protein
MQVNSTMDGTNWSGPSAVPGNGTTDAAVNASVFNGQLYLFVFHGNSISWSISTGAHAISGPIFELWKSEPVRSYKFLSLNKFWKATYRQ